MLSELSESEVNSIIARLKEKGVSLPCPRCGQRNWNVDKKIHHVQVQGKSSGITIGGPTIPSTVTYCTHCGFIAYHALGALGFLPKGAMSFE